MEPDPTGRSDQWIELDDRSAQVRVRDPRLFQSSKRAYARRVLEALCEHPGVRRAEVDLESSTCLIDFDLDSNNQAIMARVFVDAIRASTATADRTSWWDRRPRWSSLTAYRSYGDVSVWETLEDQPGLVRLHAQGPSGDPSACSRLSERLARLEGVKRSQVAPSTGQITVVCARGDGISSRRMVDQLERILKGQKAADHQEVGVRSTDSLPSMGRLPSVATGWKRVQYLAMAGAALTLTVVGLVVPGIPTVPFLLATSYYLARSSPVLDERLRRTIFLGPILQEWEGHSALSLTSKGKLVGLTVAILVVTVVLMPLNAVVVILILLIASLSLYEILRMPTLANDMLASAGEGIATPHPMPLPAH